MWRFHASPLSITVMELINLISEISTLDREGLILACSVGSSSQGCSALSLWACDKHKAVNRLGGRERNG